jgi:hypothetical protein
VVRVVRYYDLLKEDAMATHAVRIPNETVWVTAEEESAFFDEEARRFLDISGEEFSRRLAAGEYDAVIDDPRHGDVAYLALLSSVAH